MGQMYYYQTEFQLKDEVPFLNVVKAYAEDDDLTEADLEAVHPLFDSWSDPHGPTFEFDGHAKTVKILMDTNSSIHFGHEFEAFLTRCANEFSTAGAILAFEGEDRDVTTYGDNGDARTALMAGYLRDEIEHLRGTLRQTINGVDLSMDKATELVRSMRDLIEEAMTTHIYDPDDEIPPDCKYRQAYEQATELLDGR